MHCCPLSRKGGEQRKHLSRVPAEPFCFGELGQIPAPQPVTCMREQLVPVLEIRGSGSREWSTDPEGEGNKPEQGLGRGAVATAASSRILSVPTLRQLFMLGSLSCAHPCPGRGSHKELSLLFRTSNTEVLVFHRG